MALISIASGTFLPQTRPRIRLRRERHQPLFLRKSSKILLNATISPSDLNFDSEARSSSCETATPTAAKWRRGRETHLIPQSKREDCTDALPPRLPDPPSSLVLRQVLPHKLDLVSVLIVTHPSPVLCHRAAVTTTSAANDSSSSAVSGIPPRTRAAS
ncbi:hypothetical protein C8F04DRAFT_154330 [Mycena alexandri]|uniref:Uncharacterized protein n=1 Tax=Mycena alexandri TaxID=1745969 RepID=A0AAD6WTE8_9AGAR|nr:hypothetical protein C8F04DRAFT_154330 [Mycena alexandri]